MNIEQKIESFLQAVDAMEIKCDQSEGEQWLEAKEEFDCVFKKYRKNVSDKLPKGLQVGKLVAWAQADGRAWYVITKVGQDICELAWIPYGDSWVSPVVQEGKALTAAVAQSINRDEGMRELFRKQAVKEKKIKGKTATRKAR